MTDSDGATAPQASATASPQAIAGTDPVTASPGAGGPASDVPPQPAQPIMNLLAPDETAIIASAGPDDGEGERVTFVVPIERADDD